MNVFVVAAGSITTTALLIVITFCEEGFFYT